MLCSQELHHRLSALHARNQKNQRFGAISMTFSAGLTLPAGLVSSQETVQHTSVCKISNDPKLNKDVI